MTQCASKKILREVDDFYGISLKRQGVNNRTRDGVSEGLLSATETRRLRRRWPQWGDTVEKLQLQTDGSLSAIPS
jgi:hypothetical protein